MTTDNKTAGFSKSWRYKIGLLLIVVGHLVLLFGLVGPVIGLVSAALAGGILIGGEVISLLSIVFLGKDGFLAIKSKVFKFLKSGYIGPVSATRHAWGITLIVTSFITSYLIYGYAWIAFKSTTVEDPLPIILGMNLDEQADFVLILFLIGELSFLAAIYVLGADWWERFRNLFKYHNEPAE